MVFARAGNDCQRLAYGKCELLRAFIEPSNYTVQCNGSQFHCSELGLQQRRYRYRSNYRSNVWNQRSRIGSGYGDQ